MSMNAGVTQASKLYAAAHGTHYEAKDLRAALGLYQSILAAHPDSPEAGHSTSQIRNIVQAVVSKQDLLDAEVGLARAHFERADHEASTRATAIAPAAG